MTDELDEILTENAIRRAEERQAAASRAAEAADVIDRLAHPDENDEQRQARQEAEQERLRLKALGVRFTDE